MNADNQDFKYNELTEAIIRIFYRVYNKLGVLWFSERKVSHMVCDFFKFAYFSFPETYKNTAELATN
jgi:hypothetical protein